MNTLFLYDEGEETWPHKYHLGCGGVFLDGYKNCDVSGVSAFDHQSLVERNRTTINDYYARLDGNMHSLPQRRETVCDIILDASKFNAIPETVDKIVAVQLFEHFTPVQAMLAMGGWVNALRAGGVLIISVPDMEGTLDLIARGNGDTDFALRHLRGRQGDKWNSHHAWYTLDTLIELLRFAEFSTIVQLPNFHFYPALVVKAIK